MLPTGKEEREQMTEWMDKAYDKHALIGMIIMLAKRLDDKVSTEPDCQHALTIEMLLGFLRETSNVWGSPLKDIIVNLLPNWQKIEPIRRKKGI